LSGEYPHHTELFDECRKAAPVQSERHPTVSRNHANRAALQRRYCIPNVCPDGFRHKWRRRIQGWIEPPVLPVAGVTENAAGKGQNKIADEEVMADQKEIVTEWAKEFKLEGLWGDDEPAAGDALALTAVLDGHS